MHHEKRAGTSTYITILDVIIKDLDVLDIIVIIEAADLTQINL